MGHLRNRGIAYCTIALVLTAALSLAACGRKAGLDAPPSSEVPAVPPQANAQPSLGAPGPFFAASPDTQPTAPSATVASPPPSKKTFLLDPLIN